MIGGHVRLSARSKSVMPVWAHSAAACGFPSGSARPITICPDRSDAGSRPAGTTLGAAARPAGGSLAPAARMHSTSGAASAAAREAAVHQSAGGNLAIRQGPWKPVFLASGKRELYNLETELGETRDVRPAHSDMAARLTARLQDYTILTAAGARPEPRSRTTRPFRSPAARRGSARTKAKRPAPSGAAIRALRFSEIAVQQKSRRFELTAALPRQKPTRDDFSATRNRPRASAIEAYLPSNVQHSAVR